MRTIAGGRLSAGRGGSILIALIITLLVVAIAGAAVFYLTTGSTFTGLLKNNNLKAYYLAESGARFAYPLILADLNDCPKGVCSYTNMKAIFGSNLTNKPAYTLSTGQFTLAVSNVTNSTAMLTSTGIVGSGWMQTKRQVIYRVMGTQYPGSPTFSDLSTEWNWGPNTTNLGGSSDMTFNYDSKNGGLQGLYTGNTTNDTGGLLTFSSSNPTVQDLWQAWQDYGNLSYQLQEKIWVDNNSSNFFMIGLSFRVDQSDTSNPPPPVSFYGISYFRKNNSVQSSQIPLWWTNLTDSSGVNEFDTLKNDKLYMVFWEYLGDGVTDTVRGASRTCNNTYGCYYLLDYSPLTGVVTTDGTNLLDNSAIVVNVQDVVSGGVHANNISAYAAQSQYPSDPYYYPVGTSTDWPPASQFYPITTWTAYPSGTQTGQPLVDNSLTPDKYYTSSTAEIGVHIFYDVNGNNGKNGGVKDLITDFGSNITSGNGSGGGQVQYY